MDITVSNIFLSSYAYAVGVKVWAAIFPNFWGEKEVFFKRRGIQE